MMSVRQNLTVFVLIDVALFCLGWWVLNTDTAKRAVDRAKGWSLVTKWCWAVARRIGLWAMAAEFEYNKAIQEAKS